MLSNSISMTAGEKIYDFLVGHQTDFMLFLEGICVIVAFMTLITKNFSLSRKINIFLLVLNSELFLISSRIYYIYKDTADPQFQGLVRSMKFLEYLLSLTIIFSFSLYLKDLFVHEAGLAKSPKLLYITDCVILAGLIVLIFAEFTGFYYTWDMQNQYHRTEYNFVCYIFPMIGLFLQLICMVQYFNKFTNAIRIPIILFIVLPIFTTSFKVFLPGIAVSSISTAGVSVMVYVFTIQEMNKTVARAHRLEIEMMEKYQKELEKTVEERTQELKIANEKAEHLLLNILPENIARELSEDPDKTISKCYPNATVMFTDIVDFTKISGMLGAEGTVRMLNRITTLFDERAKREGIEKIKTIGDAYMAAAGLTENEQNDGAEIMIRFAKGLLEDIENLNKTMKPPVKIRVGINSGELVAGVIGKIKFIYDIWGDTVNVASRMESTGTPMMIHLSESAYMQIKDNYPYRKKEEVTIKGKGRMICYYL